jgi:pyridoxine/pyridoxamine 5'-phosphate oxidase
MTKAFLYQFISRHKYAVLSTVTKENLPECALVGFAVTHDLKLIFDTTSTSRKYQNLIENPAIALVIGWDKERTVQYEGSAAIPTSPELTSILRYFRMGNNDKN